jgi:hypothetical protein
LKEITLTNIRKALNLKKYKEKYSLKRCKYCGMFYVDIDDSTRDEIMDIVKADPIFVMNIKRK